MQNVTAQQEDRFVGIMRVLADSMERWAVNQGFWDEEDTPTTIAAKVALIHSEASEFLETIRKRTDDGKLEPDHHCPEFSNAEIELADVVIRTMDLAKHLGLRLPEAIIAKQNYNETRPHKNGKKI